MLRVPRVVPRACGGGEDAEDVLGSVPLPATRAASEGAAISGAGGVPRGGARAAATISTAAAGCGGAWTADVTRRPVCGNG
jgi:hypothetical protein